MTVLCGGVPCAHRPECPVTLNFTEMQDSLYNTPPCWSIYVCGLVFKHLLAAGGIEAVEANNAAKVCCCACPLGSPAQLLLRARVPACRARHHCVHAHTPACPHARMPTRMRSRLHSPGRASATRAASRLCAGVCAVETRLRSFSKAVCPGITVACKPPEQPVPLRLRRPSSSTTQSGAPRASTPARWTPRRAAP